MGRGMRAWKPSPAMVVAVVALIAALGGSAVAAGVLGKKQVNKIITKRAPGLSVGSAKTADSAANAANLGGAPASSYAQRPQWALVSANGTIVAQSGGITSNTANAGFGEYFLNFGSSLANRPVSVVLHYPDGGITGDVSATPCGGSAVPGGYDCSFVTGVNDASHLFVRTQSDTGGLAPFGFYVTVGK